MKSTAVHKMCASALLIAIGIVIPMTFPGIRLEPASFTLASHVAVFIAMMISPGVAGAVVVGTTLGFFIGGFPIVIVCRAASHMVFAMLGAFALRKAPHLLEGPLRVRLFSFFIALVHAACEVAVASAFYFGGQANTYGYAYSILLLVGVGGTIHSLVDFEIAFTVMKVLSKQRHVMALTSRS